MSQTRPDVPLGPRRGQTLAMHIPAKVDYGMRALLTLAERNTPTTGQALADAQGLPTKFLGAILTELHRARLVASGPDEELVGGLHGHPYGVAHKAGVHLVLAQESRQDR